MAKELAYILVGDHLGQVKKVLWPSVEISPLSGLGTPSSSTPIVSIETILGRNKQLIANKCGRIYVYDCVQDTTSECQSVDSELVKAIPLDTKGDDVEVVYVYEKQVLLKKQNIIQSTKKDLKKGGINDAKVLEDKLAIVGKDVALRIYDMNKKVRLFDSDPPEKDWLGIRPETYVSGVDFVGNNPNRLATCSKSDSVIRIYDTKSQTTKPVISIDINQTAFNEHADSCRFISVSSSDQSLYGSSNYPIVIGSNVGQMLAIDLRFNQVKIPSGRKNKKLQPRSYKILGGFKGSRGASVKDIKLVTNCKTRSDSFTKASDDEGEEAEAEPEAEARARISHDSDEDDSDIPSLGGTHKVISCSLDRYLRIHNFTNYSRHLDKHAYLTTKPTCCSTVFYKDL